MPPILILLFFLFLPIPANADALPLARTVIAFYDSKVTSMEQSMAHSMAEMPLNHLGIILEYHDIQAPLPAVSQRSDVRGVLSWFTTETRIPHPERYLRWAAEMVDAGKQFVILGNPAFFEDSKGKPTPLSSINFFLHRLGLHTNLSWVNFTYSTTLSVQEASMFLPGKQINGIKPAYLIVDVLDSQVTAVLRSDGNPLVLTGPHGGYVADGYSHSFHDTKEEEIRQWYINPFRFFSRAFATDSLPKPDTTTLAGRRIFYSHIDGDGWNNYSQIEAYKKRHMLASEVIMERVAKAYPDLPLTLTLIGADIDPAWSGTPESSRVAKAFFALPNIEAGSHTYSHPFYWQFFASGDWRKEYPYLDRYPDGGWESESTRLLWEKTAPSEGELPHGYTTPRAYARKPFDINREVAGSVAAITPLLPAGKKVEILNWPGNCLPWEQAVALTRQAGLHNINGGDSRFDSEYPSYASVAPIGRRVGKELQIYASSSNENTYTDLWNGRFYGFTLLKTSLKNTETPVRIKPLNIYYHIYSGEKLAGLHAVLSNLDYARAQPVAPIPASQFAAIAEGFYSTKLIPLGENSWRVTQRGALNTLRFDHATLQTVDLARSSGVIGQRHFQGSLYVYLDQAATSPVVTLKPLPLSGQEADSPNPYLIESRWQISGLTHKDTGFRFTTTGFGAGDMRWHVPEDGSYQVRAGGYRLVATAKQKQLALQLDLLALQPLEIIVEKIKE